MNRHFCHRPNYNSSHIKGDIKELLPAAVSMLKMLFGEVGLVMVIVGESPASASENITCLKEVAAAWLHLIVTDPGDVIVGAFAEKAIMSSYYIPFLHFYSRYFELVP